MALPADPALPLADLKVLDFSWAGVGPITVKYLADHGATVVRVESHARYDVVRLGRRPGRELHAARDARVRPRLRGPPAAEPAPGHAQHLPPGADRTARRVPGLRTARGGALGLLRDRGLGGPPARTALRGVHRLRRPAPRGDRAPRGRRSPAADGRGPARRRVAGRGRAPLPRPPAPR